MIRFILAALVLTTSLTAADGVGGYALEDRLGRNETRIRSAPFPIEVGRTVAEMRLVERLEQLGYRRVSRRPERPGEFFYGHERFRIWQRARRFGGRDRPAREVTLPLRRDDGRVLGMSDAEGRELRQLRLEPLLLAESLDGDRWPRRPWHLEALPDHVWQPLLALEDARFFEHPGVDGKAVARALIANVKRGGVAQGGSTLTQQLIKSRALSPRRTLGRKASEALRALTLEADETKEAILEAYLNSVYMGHLDGRAIHGFGAAARLYFDTPLDRLGLAEAAALGAMVQGPNRLSPLDDGEALRTRRDRALERMLELGWGEAQNVRRALDSPLGARRGRIEPPPARHFVDWVAARTRARLGERIERGRGVVVETTLDPLLQRDAESAVAAHLARLRRDRRRLRERELTAALVALDAESGAVLAWVGGDPARASALDHVSTAARQPGSAVKPLLLLEAFESCGDRAPLHAATRVDDGALTVALAGGDWSPQNFDREHHGVVDLGTALERSFNIPFVRMTRWCGAEATAARLRRAGIELPDPPLPAFALGAVESSPLAIAEAFTVFASPGSRLEPFAIARAERPAGGKLFGESPQRRRVVRASTAFVVRDLMRRAVERGTGRSAALDRLEVAGKTGSSSGLRDAWFVGDSGNVVTAVWVGLERGDLGLTASAAAAPLWRRFMGAAARARPPRRVERPSGVVEAWYDPEVGLLVPEGRDGAISAVFRRKVRPRRDRWWRPDTAGGVLR